MHKCLKGELYKFWQNHFSRFSLIAISLYGLLANYLYFNQSFEVSMLYKNFIDEYKLLYLILTLFYSSFILSDEYLYKTIYHFDKDKILWVKLIMLQLFIIIIFILSFICSFVISLFFFKVNVFDIDYALIITEYIKFVPSLIIYSLICLLLSIIVKKSNVSLALTIGIYVSFSYLKTMMMNLENKYLYFCPIYSFDLTERYIIKNVVPIEYSIFALISIMILLILWIVFVFNKSK